MNFSYRFAIAGILAALCITGFAQTKPVTTQIDMDTADAPKILVNQTPMTFTDTKPGIVNGHLLIPMRPFLKMIGAEIKWANDRKQVTLDLQNNRTQRLDVLPTWFVTRKSYNKTRHQKLSKINGTFNENQVIIIDSRAYMEINQLAVTFSGQADWKQGDDTATIDLDKSNFPNQNG